MKKLAKDARVAVCVLARDCEKTLARAFHKIEALRKSFKDSRVFIVENNSVDSTKEIIFNYSKSHKGVIVDSFDDENLDKTDRIERIAYARNRYLELVKNTSDFIPDYLIVIDADINFYENDIPKAINNAPDDFVSIFANGKYYIKFLGLKIHVLYYDLFALVPEDSFNYMLTESEMHKNRFKLQKDLKHNDYVKCRSAFGGIGIYKYEALAKEKYILKPNQRTKQFKYVCEHIPLNIKLLSIGNNYICSNLHVSYEKVPFRTYVSIIRMKRRIKNTKR